MTLKSMKEEVSDQTRPASESQHVIRGYPTAVDKQRIRFSHYDAITLNTLYINIFKQKSRCFVHLFLQRLAERLLTQTVVFRDIHFA